MAAAKSCLTATGPGSCLDWAGSAGCQPPLRWEPPQFAFIVSMKVDACAGCKWRPVKWVSSLTGAAPSPNARPLVRPWLMAPQQTAAASIGPAEPVRSPSAWRLTEPLRPAAQWLPVEWRGRAEDALEWQHKQICCSKVPVLFLRRPGQGCCRSRPLRAPSLRSQLVYVFSPQPRPT